MLFRPERVIGFSFPILVERLKEKGGDVHFAGPVVKIVVIAFLLLLVGPGAELPGDGRPSGFSNYDPAARQGIPDSLDVGDAESQSLVNIFALPGRISMHGNKIQFF